MRKIYTILLANFASISITFGQITTYPYVENFDGFPFDNTSFSPYLEPNPLINNWVNVQTEQGNADWYGRQVATGSSNTGPDFDHTSGQGVYLFVEDSPNNYDSTLLLSPSFDISSLNSPMMSVWIHSRHSGSGSPASQVNELYIEVNDGTGWLVLDSIKHIGTAWTKYSFLLNNFSLNSNIIQFRFNANMNNGTLTHDIAIDDFFVLEQPLNDLTAQSFIMLPQGYTQVPNLHGYFQLGAIIKNTGVNSVPNPFVEFITSTGTFYSDTNVAISPSAFLNLYTENAIQLENIGIENIIGVAQSSVTDDLPINDTVFKQIQITDTVYARDDSSLTGGIGFNGSGGEMGMLYHFYNPTIITSASLYLNFSQGGDQLIFRIYKYAGQPVGNAIATSDTFDIPALNSDWFTVPFGECGVRVDSGRYFIAAVQLDSNNLSCGYTEDLYTPNIAWFRTGISQWTKFENSNFQITLLLRANTGNEVPIINNKPDAICTGDSLVLFVENPDSFNYVWSPPSFFPNGNIGDTVVAYPFQPGNITVTYGFGNCDYTDSTGFIQINNYPTSSLSISPSTDTVCNTPIQLSVTGGADSNKVFVDNNQFLVTDSSNFFITLPVGQHSVYVIAQNNPDCQGTSNTISLFVKDCTSGLSEISQSIFAYQSGNNIVIETNGLVSKIASIHIFDLNGRQMFSRQSVVTKSKIVIPMYGLSAGMYILKLQTDSKFGIKKIVFTK